MDTLRTLPDRELRAGLGAYVWQRYKIWDSAGNEIADRPVVRGGQIVVRKMMNLSSSFDHRVVDGAIGAKFLAAFKPLIEEYERLLSGNIIIQERTKGVGVMSAELAKAYGVMKIDAAPRAMTKSSSTAPKSMPGC